MFTLTEPSKRSLSNKRNAALGCFGVIFLCCILGIIISNGSSGADSSSTQVSNVLVTPSTTPSAQTSSLTHIAKGGVKFATNGGALLGGTEDAFEVQWGKRNSFSNDLYIFFQQSCGDVGNTWCMSLSMEPGVNKLWYVADVETYSHPNEQWNSTKAQAICDSYKPDDANFVKKVTVLKQNDVLGFDLIYTSHLLANLFPTDDFQDYNQNDISPGTFDIYYEYSSDGTYIDGCRLLLGTEQTQP